MTRWRSQPGERGVALLSAIFLLVVLGSLALYLLSLSSTQHFTSMWAAQGARAHYAAQSGLEWGAAQAINGGGACNDTLAVDAGGSAPFTVVVSCSSSAFLESGVTRTVWLIDARARSGGAIGSPGFVQRRHRATVVTP